MKRLLAVVLVVVAMIWVREIGSADTAFSAGPSGTEPSGVALALGFSLVVALVTRASR